MERETLNSEALNNSHRKNNSILKTSLDGGHKRPNSGKKKISFANERKTEIPEKRTRLDDLVAKFKLKKESQAK